MKARASSLNPYATSYVPLSRRGPITDELTTLVSTDSKMRSQAAWLSYDPIPGSTTQNHDAACAAVVLETPDINNNNNNSFKLKNHSVFGSSSSSSHNNNNSSTAELAGKQAMDVDHDMNLAYLQMIFPGVSDESLSSVYTANGADMEATVEMLNQLEVHSGDFSENLPESLDIGDVSEAAGSSGSQKLKKVAGDGSW